MKRRKRKNGTNHHPATKESYARVLRVAKRRGHITNHQACLVGKWSQGFYHLNAMRRAKLLKRTGFNTWVPR